MDASFDERISLASLLLAGLNVRFSAAQVTGAVTDACYQQLRSFKRTLTQQADADPAALFADQCAHYRECLEADKTAGALLPEEAAARTRTLALLEEWSKHLTAQSGEPDPDEAFDTVRGAFNSQVRRREGGRFLSPAMRWNPPLILWSRPSRTGRRWLSLSMSWRLAPTPRRSWPRTSANGLSSTVLSCCCTAARTSCWPSCSAMTSAPGNIRRSFKVPKAPLEGSSGEIAHKMPFAGHTRTQNPPQIKYYFVKFFYSFRFICYNVGMPSADSCLPWSYRGGYFWRKLLSLSSAGTPWVPLPRSAPSAPS